ncbi:P-loop containing nucleoside triphosphate hydrolase protein [Gloeopeniophorella convolvens]|nr:P-loop containing nucleoside triphosphate hydrolase protein [Gloeopeniophorella convolvens]
MRGHLSGLFAPWRKQLTLAAPPSESARKYSTVLKPKNTPSPPSVSSPPSAVSQGKDLQQLLRREALSWVSKTGVRQRLQRFGIPKDEVPGLLSAFARDVHNGRAFRLKEKTPAELARLSHDTMSSSRNLSIDSLLTSFLYTWATDPRHGKDVQNHVSNLTLDRMTRLRKAVDFTRLAGSFPNARKMRRKLILHVGPTNSGKTHTALRTLAAARVGAYGGPLRLLAHEIYERLNTGQIVPVGAEAPANREVDDNSNLDAQVPGAPRAVLKQGDPQFARPCNLLTGDEIRSVDGATLYSCTVEMLSLEKCYDVVVIDEIQMIADSQRGAAWTAAVLGCPAKELHLCGEERAVPIIEALAEITGDELVVNRYQRLSPLSIAPNSLESDLTRIQKGDCVVTFSRTNIFNLKREIEAKTNFRCAVAYGRLPPEIRAEQAVLFNNPDSGFDVLVASDAVGMGLNLKIRRVVFETMSKWDGWTEVPLEASQVKQIAGRAGRYGMGSEGGEVTTLLPSDLPLLKAAMATEPEPLRFARVGYIATTMSDIFEALPRNSSATTMRDALIFCSLLPPSLAMIGSAVKEVEATRYVDSFIQDLTFNERTLLLQCPFPSLDDRCKAVMGKILTAYRNQIKVDLRDILSDSGLLPVLEEILSKKKINEAPRKPRQALGVLESLHSALTAYAWLSLRNALAFHDYDLAISLRQATQDAMDYCLRNLDTKPLNLRTRPGKLNVHKRHAPLEARSPDVWSLKEIASRSQIAL